MNAVAVAVIAKPVYSAFAGHLSHDELMRRHIDTLMMLGLALEVYLLGLLVIGDPKASLAVAAVLLLVYHMIGVSSLAQRGRTAIQSTHWRFMTAPPTQA